MNVCLEKNGSTIRAGRRCGSVIPTLTLATSAHDASEYIASYNIPSSIVLLSSGVVRSR